MRKTTTVSYYHSQSITKQERLLYITVQEKLWQSEILTDTQSSLWQCSALGFDTAHIDKPFRKSVESNLWSLELKFLRLWEKKSRRRLRFVFFDSRSCRFRVSVRSRFDPVSVSEAFWCRRNPDFIAFFLSFLANEILAAVVRKPFRVLNLW